MLLSCRHWQGECHTLDGFGELNDGCGDGNDNNGGDGDVWAQVEGNAGILV